MSSQLVWASRRIADLERQLAEAQGKLDVVREWLEPSGVAQHHEVTKARNELRARILKEGNDG